MMRISSRVFASVTLFPALTACGSGDWIATTWGEAYIEEGIPTTDFADGCTAVFDTFEVEVTEVALLDGNGEVAGNGPAGRFEMTTVGPQEMGEVSVRATFYDTARFVIASSGGDSVHAAGTLTCEATSVTFDWSFDTSTAYLCEPEDLTIPAGGEATTEFTIHGDHFFYDGLEAENAAVRGQAIVDADANEDGEVTLAELDAVAVAELGYSVGQYSEVTNLGEFVTFLTRTLGHVDGEGHCQVDL